MRSADPLARVPILASFGPAERAALTARLGEARLEIGQPVFARGDAGDLLYLVAEGEVEIFLPAEAGAARVPLRRLHPGDHFGELALLDGAPRSASAVAVAPARLLTLSRDAFLEPVLASPAAARVLVKGLADRLAATNALLSERASRDVVGELDSARTAADRLAVRVAAWNGSWWFLTFLLALAAAWWAWNTHSGAAFDPYPFNFFNLVLAMLVVLQGPLLMMAQNREVAADRAAAEADYRVNLKNELALERMGRELGELRRDFEARLPPPG
jgi:uncharacterized membrane protein